MLHDYRFSEIFLSDLKNKRNSQWSLRIKRLLFVNTNFKNCMIASSCNTILNINIKTTAKQQSHHVLHDVICMMRFVLCDLHDKGWLKTDWLTDWQVPIFSSPALTKNFWPYFLALFRNYLGLTKSGVHTTIDLLNK